MYLLKGPQGAVSRHVRVEGRDNVVLVLGAESVLKDDRSRTVPAAGETNQSRESTTHRERRAYCHISNRPEFGHTFGRYHDQWRSDSSRTQANSRMNSSPADGH